MKDFHCTVLTEKRVKIIYIQDKQFLEVTVKQIIGGNGAEISWETLPKNPRTGKILKAKQSTEKSGK